MNTLSVQLNQLREHSAQMRTHLDLEEMANLTLQVYTRGLDPHQPITVAPNGTDATYSIVSGHRRWLAALTALLLRDEYEDKTVDLPAVRELFAERFADDPMAAYAQLVEKYGDQTIEVAIFEGGEAEQILALQSANYGQAEPDPLGIAKSLAAGEKAGLNVDKMAANIGQSPHYIQNYQALLKLPEELAAKISAGELAVGIARPVAALPSPKREAMSAFILALCEQEPVTVKAVKAACKQFQKWNGLTIPLEMSIPAKRNRARILSALWARAVDADPETAWFYGANYCWTNRTDSPHETDHGAQRWIETLAPEYIVIGEHAWDKEVNWSQLLADFIPDLSCETCPAGTLPTEKLNHDLNLPCRKGKGKPGVCIHGLLPEDPFIVSVPWNWSELPGVERAVGVRTLNTIRSADNLLEAWKAQKAMEVADIAAMHESVSGGGASTDIAKIDTRPIARQRALIASFMAMHTRLDVAHPWATNCANCQHRLDSSPTKDESVPHCQWAARTRNVKFYVRAGVADGDGKNSGRDIRTIVRTIGIGGKPHVPFCRQYAPAEGAGWAMIPDHAAPPGMPRAWIITAIEKLVKQAHRTTGGSGNMLEAVCEWLTGRPIKSAESHRDWFLERLEACQGELSDAQIWTLFTWVLSEWERAHAGYGNPTYQMPTNGSGVQFVAAGHVEWSRYVQEYLVQDEPAESELAEAEPTDVAPVELAETEADSEPTMEFHPVPKPCPRCKGTGIEPSGSGECLTCGGEGAVNVARLRPVKAETDVEHTPPDSPDNAVTDDEDAQDRACLHCGGDGAGNMLDGTCPTCEGTGIDPVVGLDPDDEWSPDSYGF